MHNSFQMRVVLLDWAARLLCMDRPCRVRVGDCEPADGLPPDPGLLGLDEEDEEQEDDELLKDFEVGSGSAGGFRRNHRHARSWMSVWRAGRTGTGPKKQRAANAHVLVPSVEVDSRLLVHPQVYSRVHNGYPNGLRITAQLEQEREQQHQQDHLDYQRRHNHHNHTGYEPASHTLNTVPNSLNGPLLARQLSSTHIEDLHLERCQKRKGAGERGLL